MIVLIIFGPMRVHVTMFTLCHLYSVYQGDQTMVIILHQGRIQDFYLGGGRKRLCASTHITSAEPNSLSAGVQGPLKAPGSSRVVLLLSRAF